MSHHAHDNHDNCHDCPNKTIVTSFSKTSSLCFVKADVDAHCVYDLGNSNTARTWNESWSTVASSCLRSHTYIYHKHWLLYRRIIGDNHAAAKHRNRFLVGLETLDAPSGWSFDPQQLMFFDNSRYLHSLTRSSLSCPNF